MKPRHSKLHRDEGAILPLVLVVAVVLSLVVVSLATYVTSDLRYAQVTEQRAERQAASTSAVTYGVERIRLGKTLCGASASDIGFVQPGIIDRNGTTTSLTCSRFASGLSDISGWAVVMTGEGIGSEYLQVQGGGTKTVTGPMFIQDVNQVAFSGAGTGIAHVDGDLWHHRSPCPGGPVSLPGSYNFIPANARGPLCTTSDWDDVVSAPSVPGGMAALPVNNGSTFTLQGTTCRVFAPGRYTGVPDIPAAFDAYFLSGNYYFDSIGAWTVSQQSVWFGHPGVLAGAEEIPTSVDCENARSADPNLDGAVAYLGGNSRISMSNQGGLELFPRLVNGKLVSIQQLDGSAGYTPSSVTAASGTRIYRVAPGSTADSVIHGLVWAPRGWFGFDNSSNSAKQKLLGGAVVSRMSIQASSSASGFEIAVATTPFESDILLTATSTSPGGGSTTAQAVVEYRVDEPDPDLKVAVNSLRVLD